MRNHAALLAAGILTVLLSTALLVATRRSTVPGSTPPPTAPRDLSLTEEYADGDLGFSIRYPAEAVANASYQYQALGPGKEINGVSFAIPKAMAEGTNLAEDSFASVEALPSAASCTADLFLDAGAMAGPATQETLNGNTYSVGHATDAGAGNRYEESVYALIGTSPCLAFRALTHTTVLENYPEGTVRAYDRSALESLFTAMRDSLRISQ